ncbi:hypothetical protein CBR_g4593 [Chara braunii]|uniref:Uncharacterized protein n=1 Tax=Chara braunii TaxID=69332 RepID=A0A388KI83_CHABU|nr:hypothetical protein CBR_g4593 [Chara braunii]|eukprot:GBG69762.1 hypothetical protein CBR_g4593 [Chara braunii]
MYIAAVLCVIFTVYYVYSRRWRTPGGQESGQRSRDLDLTETDSQEDGDLDGGKESTEDLSKMLMGGKLDPGAHRTANLLAAPLGSAFATVLAEGGGGGGGGGGRGGGRWGVGRRVARGTYLAMVDAIFISLVGASSGRPQQLLGVVSRGFLLPHMGESASEFVTEMSRTFSTLYKFSRLDKQPLKSKKEEPPRREDGKGEGSGSYGNRSEQRGEWRKGRSEVVILEEGDDRLVTVATSCVSANGSTAGRENGEKSKGQVAREEAKDAERKRTDGRHGGGEGSNAVAELGVEEHGGSSSFAAGKPSKDFGNGLAAQDEDVLVEVTSPIRRKGLIGMLVPCHLRSRKGRKGSSASFDRSSTEMVEASGNYKPGGALSGDQLPAAGLGSGGDASPEVRLTGKSAVHRTLGKENEPKRDGESPGMRRGGGEEVERRMIVREQTSMLMPLSSASGSHLHSQQVVPMEFLERSLAAKERSVALKYELIRMKQTELLLKSQGEVRKDKANSLQEEQNLLARSKLEAKERETRERRKVSAVAALARSFADELVGGLCIMCAALLYCGWNYGHGALSQQIGSCQAFLHVALATNRRQANVWSMTGMGYLFNGVFVGFYTMACQVFITARILMGFLILSMAAWLMMRRNAVVTAHDRPVTSLFLTLGVVCAYAGKVAVDSAGGSGWHWLMVWEILCMIHIYASCHTATVYRLLNARYPEEDEQSRKKDKGRHDEVTLRALLSVPIWVRHFVLRLLLVVVLPLVASFLAYVPSDRLVREICRAIGIPKALAALRAYAMMG